MTSPRLLEHAGVFVGEQAALGAEVARHDLHRGERALLEGPRLGLGFTRGSP